MTKLRCPKDPDHRLFYGAANALVQYEYDECIEMTDAPADHLDIVQDPDTYYCMVCQAGGDKDVEAEEYEVHDPYDDLPWVKSGDLHVYDIMLPSAGACYLLLDWTKTSTPEGGAVICDRNYIPIARMDQNHIMAAIERLRPHRVKHGGYVLGRYANHPWAHGYGHWFSKEHDES